MRSKYRLEGIAMTGVGAFDRLHIDFPAIASPERDEKKAEIHILTGPNGCGKSTVLFAIASLFAYPSDPWSLAPRLRSEQSRVDFRFAGTSFRDMVPQAGKEPITVLLPPGPFGAYGRVDAIATDRWRFRPLDDAPLHEYQRYQGSGSQHLRPAVMGSFSPVRFDFAVFAYAGQKVTADGSLGAIKEISASPFDNALEFDNSVRPELLTQWIANKRTEAALALVENAFDAAASSERSIARICEFIRDVCELDVEFKMNRGPLSVSTVINGQVVGFSVLPDGLKSIISWVADLAIRLETIPWRIDSGDVFERDIVLLLDEIDIYLHPRWQRRILPALQRLLPNAQVFVSTHSPFVVGSVEDAFVYKLGDASGGQVRAVASHVGTSYSAILDGVFGVEERFDVETEDLLRDFYRLRDEVIAGRAPLAEFLPIASVLLRRSEEVELVIGREIRQLSLILKKEIVIASDD